jgi:hypothetical protein
MSVEVQGYFTDIHAHLKEVEQRYSGNEHSSQAFAVYGAILDEVEKAISTGHKSVDLNGLWEKAREYDWDFHNRAWMEVCRNCQETIGFSDEMKLYFTNISFERKTGVDVDAIFNAVIKDQKQNPSLAERAVAFTGEALILFGPGLMEGSTLVGVGRAGIGAEVRTAVALDRSLVSTIRTDLGQTEALEELQRSGSLIAELSKHKPEVAKFLLGVTTRPYAGEANYFRRITIEEFEAPREALDKFIRENAFADQRFMAQRMVAMHDMERGRFATMAVFQYEDDLLAISEDLSRNGRLGLATPHYDAVRQFLERH